MMISKSPIIDELIEKEVIGGKYKVLELIGEGGIGRVYRAIDLSSDRNVAIKTFKEELIASETQRYRFLLEAKILKRIKHKNIVSFLDFFLEDGHLFLVIEYLEGNSLATILQYNERLDYKVALPIFQEILEGLAYLHNLGIIHRDIKPSNLFITLEGEVKIIDFGISFYPNRGERRLTYTGIPLGTVEYMAPEQIRGAKCSFSCDLYSLGVTLFETLTGSLPFSGDIYEIQKGHVEKPPPLVSEFVPDIPPKIVSAISRALSKEPENRFSSALEFLYSLGVYPEKPVVYICPNCRLMYFSEKKEDDKSSDSCEKCKEYFRPENTVTVCTSSPDLISASQPILNGEPPSPEGNPQPSEDTSRQYHYNLFEDEGKLPFDRNADGENADSTQQSSTSSSSENPTDPNVSSSDLHRYLLFESSSRESEIEEALLEWTDTLNMNFSDLENTEKSKKSEPSHDYLHGGEFGDPEIGAYCELEQADTQGMDLSEIERSVDENKPYSPSEGTESSERDRPGEGDSDMSKTERMAVSIADVLCRIEEEDGSPEFSELSEQIFIPEGLCIIGSNVDKGALPETIVELESFYIDKYPVTNQRYQKFIEETGHSPPVHWWNPYERDGRYFPEEDAKFPVTYITYYDALAFCEWAGMRLPTEEEWEKAARYTDGRPYPWGWEWENGRANFFSGKTTPVDLFENGKSYYGVYDLLGNVWEWVEGSKVPFYGTQTSQFRVLKGGSCFEMPGTVRAYSRWIVKGFAKAFNIGFRCCKNK